MTRNQLRIEKTEIPVDSETLSATVNAKDDGKIYIVSKGKVVMYPLPEFGTVEIKCHHAQVDHPQYHLFAEK
ncbi:MAG: Phage-like element protein XtrA [Neobacillus sp.]|jgi:hypothetical protein|nr:Phage-like element protein XtrA [Neobacillus sp.]